MFSTFRRKMCHFYGKKMALLWYKNAVSIRQKWRFFSIKTPFLQHKSGGIIPTNHYQVIGIEILAMNAHHYQSDD